MPSFRGSSQHRSQTQVSCISCIAGGFFTTNTIWEVQTSDSVAAELWDAGSEIESRVVVQSLSHVQLFVTPWIAVHQASLFFTVSEFAQTHAHLVGDAIQPSHPLLPPSPPVLSLSQHQGLFQ